MDQPFWFKDPQCQQAPPLCFKTDQGPKYHLGTVNQSTQEMWTLIRIPRSESPYYLELAQPLIRHTVLYFQKNGVWDSLISGNSIPLDLKPVKSHHQVFALPAHIDSVYLYLHGEGVPTPIFLWPAKEYERSTSRQQITFGIYMGILCFVVFTNLLMYFALRRWIFFHYSGLVFMYGAFSAISDGYISYLIPQIDLNYWYTLNPIVNQPNGLLYALLFLEVRRYRPQLFLWGLGLVCYFASYIYWHQWLAPVHINLVNQVHALIGIMTMAAIGIITARKGNRLGYYFALAYLVFFGIAAIEVVYLRTGQPGHLFNLSYVSLAILTEVALLSLLLTKRVQWEKEKMEQAEYEAHYEAASAKKLNEAKSDFVNTISHELRTPLTSILGFTAMVKLKLNQHVFPLISEAPPKTTKQINQINTNLDIIEGEGQRLKDLINEVLDIAKMESGRMDWKDEIFDLSQVIQRAMVNTSSLFSEQKLVLQSEFNSPLWMRGDDNRILQVLINLISNAVKFTDQGTIQIHAAPFGQVLRIQVKDSGIGIAPADLDAVFEKFKQVGNVLSDRPKGTGLGLPICKEIVEKHQGMIWVESQLGYGSTFIVDLPRSEAPQ